MGVYMIQSISHPERIYIGSTRDMVHRWSEHRSALKYNKNVSLLQNHCDECGIDDLVFEVVESGEYLDLNHLRSREQMWLTRFAEKGRDVPYFNSSPFATGGVPNKGRKGRRLSEDHKKKISEAVTGENNPMYGVTSPMKGKHPKNPFKGKKGRYSEETLQKMRISNQRAWDLRKQKKLQESCQ